MAATIRYFIPQLQSYGASPALFDGISCGRVALEPQHFYYRILYE